jgi:hypothetical protein
LKPSLATSLVANFRNYANVPHYVEAKEVILPQGARAAISSIRDYERKKGLSKISVRNLGYELQRARGARADEQLDRGGARKGTAPLPPLQNTERGVKEDSESKESVKRG